MGLVKRDAGAHPCESGLEKYVKRMVERLRDGIVPDSLKAIRPLCRS
ncbi:MAG: hypothetical protein U0Q18_18215 [Bryobacteraceae bacterium]